MASFSGGDKLEAALAEIAKKLNNAATLKVGFAGSAEENGTPVGMIAAIQEFGAPARNIPPRPFFRNMIAKHSAEWPEAIASELQKNGFDAKAALEVAAISIEGQLVQSIIDTVDPALSPVTVMLRGMRTQARYKDKKFGELIAEAVARVQAGKTNYGASTKPPVDTGTMLHSVTSVVE